MCVKALSVGKDWSSLISRGRQLKIETPDSGWLPAALLMAVYAEYRLWYVNPTIIWFTRDLGIAMAVDL